MSETVESSPPEEKPSLIEDPPSTLWGILRRLGPGLIVAGSIVGSGELIATTSTGAQAGHMLLWLIIIGCVIKVFCQVEMGRYALTEGKTTMDGLSEVPGPRIPGRGNWLVWYWFAMFLASIAQLGGIVGGVGQALAISAPLTEYGQQYNAYAESETALIVRVSESIVREQQLESDSLKHLPAQQTLRKEIVELAHASAVQLAEIKQQQLAEPDLDEKAAAQLKTQIDLLNVQQQMMADLMEKRKRLEKLSGEGNAAESDALQRQLAIASVYPFLQGILDRSQKLPDLGQAEQDEVYAEIVDLSRHIVKRALAIEQATPGADDQRQETLERLTNLDASFGQKQSAKDTALELLDPKGELSLYGIPAFAQFIEARAVPRPDNPMDDEIWAALVTAITAVMLVFGRYGLIQSFSTAMVASFTLVTIVNLFMLQSIPTWAISFDDIMLGLSFRTGSSPTAIATALATFGIIGVGASELVTYPYWCLEKGYARFTGPRDKSDAWAVRARGWLKVMQYDAWCSMVVYTFATIAFYLLGASILHPAGLQPAGNEMIRYLAVMYEPAFGHVAQVIFLFGAFAVLYSTFFVANASHARVFSDSIRVLGFATHTPEAHANRVRILGGVFPFLCLMFYVWIGKPTQLVLLSGLMQAFMLPMLAFAALFFRYYRADERIQPGRVWDVFLIISAIGMTIAGFWAAWSKIAPMIFG